MNELQQLTTGLADRYTIEHLIGEGGMASVYRAQDLRHGRAVAIKVLKPELGAILGAERFEAEIRVTAALQHPNLLPLFDSGAVGGLLYYVMPFVEGETLRARLTREKQLPVGETVRLLSAVASALAYAHGLGVIHRDLKPENILLQAGQPVVADFGIALAVSKAGGQRITQTGLSLGTPQYMSPEQATGDREVDGRSDLYALGAIAYEMLTGEPPHIGTTSQAVIARLLTEAPRPVRAVRPSVPEWLEAVVMRLLEKLPADRFAGAGETVEALRRREESASTTSGRGNARRPWTRNTVHISLAAMLLASGYFFRALQSKSVSAAFPVQRFTLSLPDSAIPLVGFGSAGAVSPSGGLLLLTGAGVSKGQPGYLRRSDQLDFEAFAAGGEINEPLFLDDGSSILYQDGASSTLRRYFIAERKTETLGPLGLSSVGLDVAANGVIVASAIDSVRRGLSTMSLTGGVWQPLTTVGSARETHAWPLVQPKTGDVFFSISRTPQDSSELAIVAIKGGGITHTGVTGVRPLQILDERLIYVRADGMLMAIPLQSLRQHSSKDAIQLGIAVTSVGPWGQTPISISRSGSLLMTNERMEFRAAELTRSGTIHAIGPFLDTRLGTWLPNSDGSRLLYFAAGQRRDQRLTYADLPTGKTLGLSASTNVTGAIWFEGEDAILVSSSAPGGTTLLIREVPGTLTPPETLGVLQVDGISISSALSTDRLLANRLDPRSGSYDILELKHQAGREWSISPVANSPANELLASLAPNKQWIAYQSDEVGYPTIVLRSLQGNGPAFPIGTDTVIGLMPSWSESGNQVLYTGTDGLLHEVSLSFRDSRPLVIGSRTIPNLLPEALPRRGLSNFLQGERFMQSGLPAGDRIPGFLGRATRGQYIYVPNWIDEFRAKIRDASRKD
jgi:serine/threonine-protein kinase